MADSISATTTVVGVKDALRVLNSIDKQARRDLTKDFKQITAPVTNDIKAKLPKSAPLSGMARKWTTASGFQMFPYSDRCIRQKGQGISWRVNKPGNIFCALHRP